jgi:TRAP-type transport system small permease protein
MNVAVANSGRYFVNLITGVSVRFAVVAEAAVVALMLLTAADVLGRYLFNHPVPGAFELTEYLGVIFVASSIACAAVRKAHVDVDILMIHLPVRVQLIAAVFGGIISFAMFAIVSWRSFVYSVAQYDANYYSPFLHVPTYPFIFIIGIGCALLSLVILTETVAAFSKVVRA